MCFKQQVASFHLKKFPSLFKYGSACYKQLPIYQNRRALFSNIAYSKFIFDIWFLFLTSLSLVWFYKLDSHLFTNRQQPVLKQAPS